MELVVAVSPYHSYLCLTSSRCRTIGLLAVKRALHTEAIESGLLSFTRVASGYEVPWSRCLLADLAPDRQAPG